MFINIIFRLQSLFFIQITFFFLIHDPFIMLNKKHIYEYNYIKIDIFINIYIYIYIYIFMCI